MNPHRTYHRTKELQMKITTIAPNDNLDSIGRSPWSCLWTARRALDALPPAGRHADRLEAAHRALDALAAVLDGCDDQVRPAARNMLGDFEDSDWSPDDVIGLGPEMSDAEFRAWVASAPETPIEVLAAQFELPALSGGSPFTPSDQDWLDFAEATDDRDWFREIDARAAGLAI
jgi:hypothetical protein